MKYQVIVLFIANGHYTRCAVHDTEMPLAEARRFARRVFMANTRNGIDCRVRVVEATTTPEAQERRLARQLRASMLSRGSIDA